MKQNIQTIKQSLFSKTGVLIFIVTAVVFLSINYYLNEFYVFGVTYLLGLPESIYIPYIIFTIINTTLVGISMVLASKRIALLRAGGLISGGGISMIGSFFGLLSGACPVCIAGFFPMVMGFLGLSFTLPGMPLYGLELQIVSALLLLIGIYFLSKPMVCKVKE